ncbi:MAG TPA: beta-galactosidase [Pseudobdellovibrionaceae bacterium]
MGLKNLIVLVTAAFFTLPATTALAGLYRVHQNQLWIDNEPQPQLFGAEVQYFRMRGGYERNIPRDRVMALWAQALDRLVEAKMNVISFYIPWDFHEYAPGKFDFDGTADEDHDGNPDYPSRDLQTFFQMIEAHGIHKIMIRPGPYINAEWGFLGFGAVPLWFHEKYPQSHMQNAQGLSTKLYDYHNPDLLRHTRLWFEELYRQVLKNKIGPGKPISFLQIDNETNFMWQSLYNHDYNPAALRRYRDFLKSRYQDLATLNAHHHRAWSRWEEVMAPTSPGLNIAEDQDWYRFADESIYLYLQKIRALWENLGVREPTVMFTLADSFNATQNGLLPNYQLHNTPGVTGVMTVNLYPKTYETPEHPLLNLPFKADHDVKAAEAASELYWGNKERWVLGPEIQGGWWRGIDVTSEARRQTYLTVLGHGLKAFFVYYFNEGDNWQSDWAKQQIRPLFEELRKEPPFVNVSEDQLSDEFWKTLQDRVDHRILVGFDVRGIMHEDQKIASQLYFDAPLDREAQPRDHYFELKELGEKLVTPYGRWLGRAVETTDPVCLIKDVNDHVPSAVANIDSIQMNSDWSGGLIAYALRTGINVRVVHWGLNATVNALSELQDCRLILRQDAGGTSQALAETLQKLITQGHTVVNFLDDSLAKQIGIAVTKTVQPSTGPVLLNFEGQSFGAQSSPLFHYNTMEDARCSAAITHETAAAAYRCAIGKGMFLQIGALFYDVYNSNQYALLSDLSNRELVLKSLLSSLKITPAVHVDADKVVAFARQVKGEAPLWVTVKSALQQATLTHIQVRDLQPNQLYSVRNLLSGELQRLRGATIQQTGFAAQLAAFGSTVFWLEPISMTAHREKK